MFILPELFQHIQNHIKNQAVFKKHFVKNVGTLWASSCIGFDLNIHPLSPRSSWKIPFFIPSLSWPFLPPLWNDIICEQPLSHIRFSLLWNKEGTDKQNKKQLKKYIYYFFILQREFIFCRPINLRFCQKPNSADLL